MLIPPIGPSEGSQPSQLRLSDGQIFKGSVLGLVNQDTEVLVEVGGRIIKSDVEVPVEAGKSYLFQYLNQGERSVLKIVDTIRPNTNDSVVGFQKLIQQWSLPNTRQTTILLNFFLDRGLPINASLIRTVQRMVGDTHLTEADLDVIEQMIEKQIPLESSLFQQLSAFKTAPQPSESLNQLMNLVQTLPPDSPNVAKLADLLATWPDLEQLSHDGTENWLYAILSRMGYFHEGQLLKSGSGYELEETSTLKTLLLLLLSEEGGNSDKLLFHNLLTTITGQQLQSLHSNPPILQYIFTLPVLLQHQFKDVHMLWERKSQEGSDEEQAIDYHNILFSFMFANLGETIIKILVQGKTLTVTLYNDDHDLTTILERHRTTIARELANLSYHLVSFKQISGQIDQMKELFKGNQQAMDVRI